MGPIRVIHSGPAHEAGSALTRKGAHIVSESGLGTESLYINEKQKMGNYSVNN